MHLLYYDEAGDDGFPRYSSALFALSSLYVHYLNWRPAHDAIVQFRRSLRARPGGLPVKLEIHARQLLLNKAPYRDLGLTDQQRIDIITGACDLIGSLPVRSVNVVIVKPRIVRQDYGVLDKALTYSIQRVENDLAPIQNPQRRFLIITDSGRVGAMRKTARRVQRVNYIPSQFGPLARQLPIQGLIEDPMPKDSNQSHFVQLCDVIAFVVYAYGVFHTGHGTLARRLQPLVTQARVRNWLLRLRPILNTAAAPDPFGVKFHP